MVLQGVGKWMARVAVAGVTLASSSAAFAQGCAMCYNSASAAKAAALHALRSGVLILLVPPLLMFIGIFVVAYRSRNRFNDGSSEDAGLDRELRELFAQPGPIEPGAFQTSRPEQHYPVS